VSKILDQAVASPDGGGTYDFTCPGIRNSICGDLATGAPFTSTGWPTKKAATARGQQHFDEHKGIAPTQPMDEFMAAQGLVTSADGRAVTLEDI
jgi:hypothetical protein